MSTEGEGAPSAKWALSEKQAIAYELLAGPQRHTLFVGGSRSGKTTMLTRAMCIRAMMYPRSRHVIVRHTQAAVVASIWHDTLPKVCGTWFPHVKVVPRGSLPAYEFPNRSQIWVTGLDEKERVEKIFGTEYSTIYFNECSQIPFSSVQAALTRLAQTQPGLKQRAYYDLNPTGRGHWTYLQFGSHVDPVSKQPITDPENYVRAFINPADNAANLSPEYITSLKNMPERQRRRFYEGAYVDEYEDALWTYEGIEASRVEALAEERRKRVVVAIDPSGAGSKEDESADEIGIIVAALGDDGHAYVLADRSVRDSPAVWGRVAVDAYHEFKADYIIAERNFGGAMVLFVIATADKKVPVHVITASRGKAVRAEPISALYVPVPETNRPALVHHVGRFPTLEDQLCAFTSAGYRGEDSPDHADALVWALTDLMLTSWEPPIVMPYATGEPRYIPGQAASDFIL